MKNSDECSPSWEKLWESFHQIREAEPEDRANLLSGIQQSDPILFDQVKELLAADEKSGAVFEEIVAKELFLLEEVENSAGKMDEVLAGRFRILRELGKGGMGSVYEALDEELGIHVALKMMRNDLALDPAARERFHREINFARQITHPNACRIFDLFRHEDLLFLTMELLQGETLHQKIRREGALPSRVAMSIALQVSQALTAIHNAGILHRDFKSSNILLIANGNDFRAVVTDFGLARTFHNESSLQVTETGQMFGTPEFMAPEQITKGVLTPATDVYALGLVFHEMVTGKLPLDGESPLTIAARRTREDVASPRAIVPDLSRHWEQVILRCLERNPKHRYQNAAEVTAALKGELLTTRLPVFPKRHRTRLLTVIASLSLICLTLLGYFWVNWKQTVLDRKDVVAKRLWTGATGLPAGVLSTDGRVLIDVDWETADVMSIEFSTGKKRRITNSGVYFLPREYVSHPLTTAISNHGRLVAYSLKFADGRKELKVSNIDGSQERSIYLHKTVVPEPSGFSPRDDQLLTLLRQEDGTAKLALFSIEKKSHRVLASLDSANVRKSGFSSDGKFVVFDHQLKGFSQYDLFIVSLETGKVSPIVTHSANDYLLGWVPGRDQIVFASDRAGTNDAWVLNVSNGQPDGDPERTRKDIGQIFPLKLTDDGSLYYSHLLTSSDVYIASRNQHKAVKVSQGVPGSNRYAQFSPDGKYLLFQTVKDPVSNRWSHSPMSILRTISMEDGWEKDVHQPIHLDVAIARWSKDGQSFLGYSLGGTDGPGLYSITPETGQYKLVLPKSAEKWISQFDWTSDGSSVFYLSDPDRTIRLFHMGTGKDRAIHENATNFSISKDGLWMAVTNVNIYNGITELNIVPSTGGKARKILSLRMPEYISEMEWTVDGREILISKGRRDLIDQPHALWSVPVSGGKPQDLSITTEYVQFISAHPDGNQFAVSTNIDTSEVWMMENFLQQGFPPSQ
jgi:serine/threonine protein kinase